jgi:hypothetical protein
MSEIIHQDITHNYGFYTLIWDRLFGTLRPDYRESFGRIPVWVFPATPPVSAPPHLE